MENNYKEFISSVEVGEYRNNIGVLGCIFCCALVAATLKISVNLFSLVLAAVIMILMIVYIFMLIKKSVKWIILYESIQGILLILSIYVFILNMLNHKDIFMAIVLCTLVALVLSAVAGILAVKIRFKSGYYKRNIENAAGFGSIIGLGIIVGICSKFFARALRFNEISLIIISAVMLCILGYKTSENLLRQYYVCKYKLYSAVRVKSY